MLLLRQRAFISTASAAAAAARAAASAAAAAAVPPTTQRWLLPSVKLLVNVPHGCRRRRCSNFHSIATTTRTTTVVDRITTTTATTTTTYRHCRRRWSSCNNNYAFNVDTISTAAAAATRCRSGNAPLRPQQQQQPYITATNSSNGTIRRRRPLVQLDRHLPQCHQHHLQQQQQPQLLSWISNQKQQQQQQQQRYYVSIRDDDSMELILSQIPLADVRNFCFIAHVDHGKSSLSSRLLEYTGNLGTAEQLIAMQYNSNHNDNDNTTKNQTDDDTEAASTTTATTVSSSSSSSSPTSANDEVNTDTTAPADESQRTTATNNKSNNNSVTTTTNNNNNNKERINLLDTLAVEQQRGITVKASTATMLYQHPCAIGPTGTLLLNMYDTPGHVDFGREVSRSLSFVQGAVLLLDATQGIQAQTWSVYDKVQAIRPQPPKLIIALTKIDLPNARPDHVALTVADWLQYDDPDAIIYTSARNRIGIKQILDTVCEQIPAPTPLSDDTDSVDSHSQTEHDRTTKSILRAQVVDSWYDSRGVNCLIQIVAGQLKENDRISIITQNNTITASTTASGSDSNTGDESTATTNTQQQQQQQQSQQSYSVQEVGIMLPQPLRTKVLVRGQMGYVRFGLRDPRQAMPGTILIPHAYASKQKKETIQLPSVPMDGITSKSVLYASVHPTDSNSFEELCNAVERLALNDTGLEVTKTGAIGDGSGGGKSGPFLGPGLRVGFQGLLHVEVFRQRLQDEFQIDAVVTPPKVPYRITWRANKKSNNQLTEDVTKIVEDLSEWPAAGTKYHIVEPVVDCRIIARVEDAGAVMELMRRKRGAELTKKPIDEEKWLFTARIPWAEVVTDLHDQLKNVTAGYGSLDTQKANPPWAEANLSKVDIMLNGEGVAPLSFVCHRDVAHNESKAVCRKLKEVLPRQQFVTIIQAKADGKIVASERIQAYRKDVLTKSGKVVGGGDQTRKMKLLEKQKKGKERMQQTGKVSLSQAAFNSVITRSS